MQLPSSEAIRAEMARRGIKPLNVHPGASDLITYTQHTTPAYIAHKFHRDVADALMAVERGEIRRLMISAPPRHGKTQLVSKRFPLWYLGRNPDKQIIHCGYGGTIAEDAGRELRNLTYNPAHRDVFPDCYLMGDSKAVNKWHTTNGGVYVAAGVGGPITGRGFHLGIIDDPVKGREEAGSEVIQRKTWAWYKSDFFTRRMKGNAIVAIGTRWHENDLFGHLLEENIAGEEWTHLRFPALDENDNALCPELIPKAELEISRALDPREWQALYQGDPTPETGTYFEAGWLKDGFTPPPPMRFYGASDYAVTEDGGDYTVHVVVGVDPHDNLWLMDLWRGQTTPDKWIEPLIAMMARWEPLAWLEEKGQIEKSVGPFLFRRMTETKTYCRRIPLTSSVDKPTRARSLQARMSQLGLYIPVGAVWAGEVRSELMKFPQGKNDDIVDALSLIGRGLAGLQSGTLGKEPDKKQPYGALTLEQAYAVDKKQRRLARRAW